MVSGNIKDGFKTTLDTYILGALADIGHVYVILFSLFLSGLVGMMEKSGGMYGFTKDIAVWATTARTGQLACFCVGILVFFDDYANLLLAGGTMRPLFDMLCISREKLAFIVDATAAPIASISPVSSWVGFEVNLIQDQLDRIIELEGANITIKTTGLGVFLQSIKYRYYPIFMIVMMAALIYSERDFGTMLIAERKTRVYKRTDGGDGKGKAGQADAEAHNGPNEGTPLAAWNMFMPILLLVRFL
jgi:Na+/H+ antiporter NhaC